MSSLRKSGSNQSMNLELAIIFIYYTNAIGIMSSRKPCRMRLSVGFGQRYVVVGGKRDVTPKLRLLRNLKQAGSLLRTGSEFSGDLYINILHQRTRSGRRSLEIGVEIRDISVNHPHYHAVSPIDL